MYLFSAAHLTRQQNMRLLFFVVLFSSCHVFTQTIPRLVFPIGHTGYINSAVFSPNGKMVITTGQDNTARIYEAASGKELHVFNGYNEFVSSAKFSPTGKLVLTAGDGHKILLFDVLSGKLVNEISTVEDLNSGEFSPDGKLLLTIYADSLASIYDVITGKRLRVLKGHSGFICTNVFSFDGKLALTAGSDGTARIFDVSSGKELRVLKGHSGILNSAQFSPDGKLVLTACEDGTARIFEVSTGNQVEVFTSHKENVLSAIFSSSGKYVLTACHDGTARVFEVSTGNQLHVLTGHAGDVVSAVFSPDEKLILTTGEDFTSRIFDLKTGSCLDVLVTGLDDPCDYYPSLPSVFSPDGSMVLYSFYKKIRIKQAVKPEIYRSEEVSDIKMSGDGKQAFILKSDLTGHLVDVVDGKEIRLFEEVYAGDFHADCKRICTVNTDQTARLYDLVSGNEIQRFSLPKEVVNTLQFSPDGKTILVVSEQHSIRLYDVSTGKELHNWQADDLYFSCFNPTGKFIVTQARQHENGENVIRIYDRNEQRLVQSFFGYESPVFTSEDKLLLYDPVSDLTKLYSCISGVYVENKSFEYEVVTCSKDGKWIVTIDVSNRVHIYDVESGKKIQVLAGSSRPYRSILFSNKGEHLFVATSQKILIYEISSGKVIEQLADESEIIMAIYNSADRNILAMLNSANTATFYKLNLDNHLLISGQVVDADLAAFSSLSQFASIASSDYATIFDVFTGQFLQRIKLQDKRLQSMCLSPDHKWLLTNQPETNSSRIYQVNSGDELKLPNDFYLESFPKVGSKVLLEEWGSNKGIVYDLALKKELFAFNAITCAALHPNGELIIIVEDSIARVYETSTGTERFTISMSSRHLVLCDFSPSGEQLYIAEDSSLRIFETTTGKLQQKFDVEDMYAVSFSPDSKLLLIESLNSSESYLLDIITGNKLHRVNLLNHNFTTLKNLSFFSPNSQSFLWWDSDSTIRIYDIIKDKEYLINTRFGPGEGVVLTPDSKQVLLHGFLSSVHIHDLSTGKEVHVLAGHTSSVYAASISPDGKYITTIGDDNRNIVWDALTGKQLFTHLQLEGNDWLVYDEHKHFDGTPKAISSLYLTCGLDIIDVNRVKDSLWIPGLANKIMNGEPLLIQNYPAPKLSDLKVCE